MTNETEQLSFENTDSQTDNQPVVCLGMTFKNDEERREYFKEELRKKLPELKKIEGFPIGNDEDIIALSDPPYYTACPNPWISEIISEWKIEKQEKFGVETQESYHREPFISDVSEGKYDPLYKLHPYLTKVPHRAIMRYILHYTKPGDIIFDGFSGSGMTGVASQMCGDPKTVMELKLETDADSSKWEVGTRKVILNDLSSIASYITYHHNKPPYREIKEIENILDRVHQMTNWMYKTLHHDSLENKEEILNELKKCNSIQDFKVFINKYNRYMGDINYVAWSEVFICPHCSSEIVFWEAGVDKEKGKVFDEFKCPNCNALNKKRTLEKFIVSSFDKVLNSTIEHVKYVPVMISYTKDSKRYDKKPDEFDLKLIEILSDLEIGSNVPKNKLPKGDKTGEPIRSGITHVHHFYSTRNLQVLSTFLSLIEKREFGFALTRVATQITKMYRFTNQSGVWGAGGGPLSGTLYIPSLIKELHILNQIRQAVKQQISKQGNFSTDNFVISNSSSTDISQIKAETIDYIFLDPPFGSNLMYSELNFIWESWLGVLTNNHEEAIINNTQEKDINEYRILISKCFKEAFRILKPGRWLTVEFSNTKSSVWNSIQTALEEAGFVIANVSVLDKKKGTFKVVTTTTAVKQDLIISAYKPKKESLEKMIQENNTEESAWTFVRQHLDQLPVFSGSKGEATIIAERTPRILFDRMVAYHVQNGLIVPLSSGEFQRNIMQRFPLRDGMIFLESQIAEYDKKRILVKDFTQLTLFVTDENSAIEWIRQQLLKKPQTRQDLHPNYMKEIQHIAKHELLPELDDLLYQNFLRYEGAGPVPDQVASYLRKNYKDLRGLENDDAKLKEKALNRWYVPDPNKQADLEKLREKSLLREFEGYVEELSKSKKKLKQFRTEAIRAGFKKAWGDKDYQKIVTVGDRLPGSVIQEDDKLLMYYDNAQIRLGL